MKAEKKNLSSMLHFYNMLICPLECFFVRDTTFGEMLLQLREQLNKSLKIVHVALRSTNRTYAPLDLDYTLLSTKNYQKLGISPSPTSRPIFKKIFRRYHDFNVLIGLYLHLTKNPIV